MLTSNSKLLMEDVKGLDYKFVEQTGYWRSITVTGNNVHRIIVVARLTVERDDIVDARVEQYYAKPRSKQESDLSLEDTRDITFKDKEFVQKLLKIRDQ